jgi:hypothetical protein
MKQNSMPLNQPTLTQDPLPSDLDPAVANVLIYLREKLPGYPFQLSLDTLFVHELLEDFPDVDVLEEVKTYRWYYDRELGKKNHRASIRRWMANTKSRGRW